MTDSLAPVLPEVAPPSAPPAVVASQLTRHYGEGETIVHALRGVDLKIETERLTAVMGPSGSGKSTLMHLLAGLDHPDGGQVWIGETEVTGLDDDGLTALRRDHIGFIFQFFNLLPMLTAEENILLPLEIAGRKPDPDWYVELIAKVGLGRAAHPPPQRAVRRPAAARGGRPRPRLPADGDVRRRADRQPRLHDERRDPRAHARPGRQLRPDDGHGHPRPARGGDRRPRAVPRRRPDRARPRILRRTHRHRHDGGAEGRHETGRAERACGGGAAAPR